MKPCSSSYANANRRQKDGRNCANGWPLNIPSHMLVSGKDDAHAIAGCGRISSISAAALSSTICTSSLVPSSFRLSFRTLLDYLTGALEEKRYGDPPLQHRCHPLPVLPLPPTHDERSCSLRQG